MPGLLLAAPASAVVLALALVLWHFWARNAETKASSDKPLMDIFPVERYVWQMFADTRGRPERGSSAADVGYFHRVSQERHPQAACLDGSPPGFYLRRAPQGSPNASKWFLYFQGGGACNFRRPRTSVFSCHGRRKTQLGSTLYDESSRDFSYKTVFSRDPSVALTWHDWNVALLRYCDGYNWNSAMRDPVQDGDLPPLYFRGIFNAEALVRTLAEEHGMATAEDVVAYGCSSGASAVVANADRIRAVVPSTTFLTLVADSAYYPDFSPEEDGEPLFVPPHWAGHPTPNAVEKSQFRQGVRHLLDPEGHAAPATFRAPPLFQESFHHFDVLDANCTEALSKKYSPRAAQYLCSHMTYALPHVDAPLFVLNSKFDAYVIRGDVVQPPTEKRRLRAEDDVNHYGAQVAGSLQDRVAAHRRLRPHAALGVLLDSCFHHCEWWGLIRYSPGGPTNAEEYASWHMAVREWWERGEKGPPPRLLRVQDQPFPCKDCCETPWNESVSQWHRLNGGRAS